MQSLAYADRGSGGAFRVVAPLFDRMVSASSARWIGLDVLPVRATTRGMESLSLNASFGNTDPWIRDVVVQLQARLVASTCQRSLFIPCGVRSMTTDHLLHAEIRWRWTGDHTTPTPRLQQQVCGRFPSECCHSFSNPLDGFNGMCTM
jgi:hypothetical protein